MKKYTLSVLFLSLFLFSCANLPADVSATTAPAEVVPVATLTPIVPTQTVAPNLIPKHNDLIFVEFFAVT
jgi:hypothetical protein